MSKITYLGSNHTDRTVTFAIDGKRWEYWLRSLTHMDTCTYLIRKVSVGKAFAFAKRHASSATLVKNNP